jgi:putative peptide zinc metalloprotease protein
MLAQAGCLAASSSRPVALRVRPDLQACQQRFLGIVSWIIKEPLGLAYFRFKEEEYFLLRQLDGRTSLAEVKDRFERAFQPQKITLDELQHFIASLHRRGLVISDSPGQGEQLKARRDARRRRERLAAVTNLLSIRFRGIDPQGILGAIYPFVRWMFSPAVVLLCLMLAVAALVLVTVEFDAFLARLPSFHQFFSPANIFWLLVVLGVTKVVHEFGHGLTCRHYGGECHEMGVMLLVLTPCLYCNVSDSWMLPNKWHRAAIGAAGMYIELVMASIATFLWWFSEPGLFHHLCLSVMFVCSVTTLVFNANPLMRYDGYYILSDLLEIPNLRQKAGQVLSRALAWLCLGLASPVDPFLPKRRQMFFASYAIAAAVYRWVVLFGVLWFLDQVFKPYRLQVIGQMIALASIAGLIVMPIVKGVQFFWVPGRVEKVNKFRALGTLAAIVLGGIGVATAPLPYHVFCPVEVRMHEATPVYVEVSGTLEAVHTQPGQQVQVQPTSAPLLATLVNRDVDASILALEGRLAQAKAHLAGLELQRNSNEKIGVQLAPARETVTAIAAELAEARKDKARLLIRAPQSGTVMPPPATEPDDADRHAVAANGRLPTMSGTPFDAQNVGCHLKTGDLLCLIGDPAQMEAQVIVDQGDIEFVREGQEIEIKLDELPGHTLRGVIDEVSRSDLKASPRNLSNKAGGELATSTDAAGVERPLSTSFQARVRLENPEGLLRLGLRGTAKIHAGRQTLASRFYRYLSQTFRIKRA